MVFKIPNHAPEKSNYSYLLGVLNGNPNAKSKYIHHHSPVEKRKTAEIKAGINYDSTDCKRSAIGDINQRRIDPERWDSHANRVKGSKEEAKEINSLIDTLILKLNKIYNRLIENDETITATRIKEIYLGKDVRNRTLLEVFRLHNEMVKSRVGVDFSTSTYTRYQTTFDHVNNFLLHQYKLEDILLKQIQYSFITDLKHYIKDHPQVQSQQHAEVHPQFPEDHQ